MKLNEDLCRCFIDRYYDRSVKETLCVSNGMNDEKFSLYLR